MSTFARSPRPIRYPLGLPPGSVRTLLALGTLVLLWSMTLVWPKENLNSDGTPKPVPMIFIYMQFLMLFIMAHFFGSHGSSIGSHLAAGSPLGLPSGAVRLLLLVGYLAMSVDLYLRRADFHYELPNGAIALLVALLLGGYILGNFLGWAGRSMGGESAGWFQDIQAWLALLALILMTVLLIVYLFVNPSLPDEAALDMRFVEGALSGLIGLYFGSRG